MLSLRNQKDAIVPGTQPSRVLHSTALIDSYEKLFVKTRKGINVLRTLNNN